MKEQIHIKNIFRTEDIGLIEKAVTEKIEKLINAHLKRKSD